MKLVWKKTQAGASGKKRSRSKPVAPNPDLPFESAKDETEAHDEKNPKRPETAPHGSVAPDPKRLAETFQSEGNRLAEVGRYHEALGKWESALTLVPELAILHEQKAQVLLEIGDAWSAIRAATRAMELEPSWAEAWITLGRAQLNFGEPDLSITSFDRALAIKPDNNEAREDRETAINLVKRQKHLQLLGTSVAGSRYEVRDKDDPACLHISKVEDENNLSQDFGMF